MKGAVLSVPTETPSTKNSTLVTDPSESVALASKFITVPVIIEALFAGVVILTTGGIFGSKIKLGIVNSPA